MLKQVILFLAGLAFSTFAPACTVAPLMETGGLFRDPHLKSELLLVAFRMLDPAYFDVVWSCFWQLLGFSRE